MIDIYHTRRRWKIDIYHTQNGWMMMECLDPQIYHPTMKIRAGGMPFFFLSDRGWGVRDLLGLGLGVVRPRGIP